MVDVPDDLELTDPQTRVLGCLLEKQMTTPDAYPLTLKALTTACNQTSNRDPVVDYEPTLVEATVQALKGKGLVRVVHPAAGERATKYRQVADEALGLDAASKALLCVLLLRGAQTVNELRTRTERMHRFADNAEVERTLQAMTVGSRPLVERTDPGPGRKEPRWIQLLQVGLDSRRAAASAAGPEGAGGPGGSGGASRAARVAELEARIAALESRVDQLIDALDGLVETPEPTGGPGSAAAAEADQDTNSHKPS